MQPVMTDVPIRVRSLPGDQLPAGSRFPFVALVITHAVALGVMVLAAGSWSGRLGRLGLIAAGALFAVLGHQVGCAQGVRWPSWIGLAVTVATTTTAATLGLKHLSVVGVTLRSAGAVVAAISGVVIMSGLVNRLAAGVRWRWRLLVGIPVTLALVAFVVYPVATATHATTQPPARLGARTPIDLGLAYEQVTFVTADGLAVSGWLLPGDNGAAVVVRHGASSTRTSVLDHAGVLNRRGYAVLLADARGDGLSAGRPMDLGWYGDLDVMAAVDFLVTRGVAGPGDVGVLGMSMGGEEALGALAADPRIGAVVAEGAQNRTYADRDDWLPGGWKGWLQRRMDEAAFALTDLVTPAQPPTSLRDAVALAAPRPVLLLAGVGEERAAESVQRGAANSVEIWRTGTGHTRGLADHPAEWEQRVVGFFDANLITD